MSDKSDAVVFTPSDIVGAIKQGLVELQAYLANVPVDQVNAAPCLAHMERMMTWMARLHSMQPEEKKAG